MARPIAVAREGGTTIEPPYRRDYERCLFDARSYVSGSLVSAPKNEPNILSQHTEGTSIGLHHFANEQHSGITNRRECVNDNEQYPPEAARASFQTGSGKI